MTTWARRATQAIFLLLFLFLFLQTESKGADTLGYPAKIFLDFSPLLALATLLSGHALMKAMLLSIIVAALTIMFGRLFCGWACPFGTIHNMAGALKRWKGPQRVLGYFRAKYLLLAFLLGGSIAGIQLTGLFDPLSLLIRHLALGFYPAFNYAANGAMNAAYRLDIAMLSQAVDVAYGLLKKTVLAFQQPYYSQGALMTLLLAAIIALNLTERRFWCRYVCPLGALLGLLGRWAPFKRRVADGCSSCGICDRACKGGIKNEAWMPSECLYCMACKDKCPKKAVSFGLRAQPAPDSVALGRRGMMLAAGAGLASAAVSRATPGFNPNSPSPDMLRPPGALPELEFLARCVKCGECMKVCTTNGLQATFLEAGLEGIWTPILVPKIGYCEYNCTLCGQVCPTGAIRLLSQEQKRAWRIGTAWFDKNRCLPHALGQPCIVCEEFCPTPTKAIKFKETGRTSQGQPIKEPYIDLKTCTGCGICVTKCPLVDKAGVYVTSIGETRSKKNQILLDEISGGGGY